MAVDSYTYGTVEGVQRYVGYMVTGRIFEDNTFPSLTDVEKILDSVASEIHGKLSEAGYQVLTKAAVLALSARACNWLESVNITGACAKVIMTHPAEASPESGGRPSFQKMYTDMLADISSTLLGVFGLPTISSTSGSSLPWSGSYEDADGDVKKPMFKRGMFDYPSSRSLEEPS